MALPPRLPKGTPSHMVRVRVPRHLWHQFLEACENVGAEKASEALRDSMRMFIRQSNRKRVIAKLPGLAR